MKIIKIEICSIGCVCWDWDNCHHPKVEDEHGNPRRINCNTIPNWCPLDDENKAEHHLKNLLAVIHRDGGHYTEEYGIEKSVKDAIQIVADAIVR